MMQIADDIRHVLVGHSQRTTETLEKIDLLGKGRWPVLVLGETGTGKEVVARTIHRRSASKEPFVTIDCSSLVGPLIESELFGHVKGAFTGAAFTKVGLIESANGGTAFFDEIGELPLDVQAKLLRVLQEKEFRPVGSLSVRRSDFRIIAATNRDLAKEVEKGTFRQDLFYRLNVIKIRLSPLRERQQDIPVLINHFLTRLGAQCSLTADAMDALLAYDWPGNVRELENCVQHMVAISSGPLLHVTDLPSSLQNFRLQRRSQFLAVAASAAVASSSQPAWPSATNDPQPAYPAILPLAEVERRAIESALERTKGDRGLAAHLLGIGRTTLYRKLKEYQLAGADAA
jgi:DNA-binding NtrC family response regulator